MGEATRQQSQINLLKEEQIRLSKKLEEVMEKMDSSKGEHEKQYQLLEEKLSHKINESLGQREETMALKVAELVTSALKKGKETVEEEEHGSVNTISGNMVNMLRTPISVLVPSEMEMLVTPQQASSSYPRPEPPSPPITVPFVPNAHIYSGPLNSLPPRPLITTSRPIHNYSSYHPLQNLAISNSHQPLTYLKT
jgi:hypothetical protein